MVTKEDRGGGAKRGGCVKGGCRNGHENDECRRCKM